MRIIKEKKAQIAATLTWFFVFVIIFFIMLLFISACIAITSSKKIFGSIFTITSEIKESSYAFSETESLFAILNTEIEAEINGKKENKTIPELVEYSIEPYIHENNFEDFNERGMVIYDEALLSGLVGKPTSEFYSKTGADARNRILFENSKNLLNKICDGYVIVFPQGVIYREEGKDAVYLKSLNDVPETEKIMLDYDRYYSLAFFAYKGHIIKIKYKQLVKC